MDTDNNHIYLTRYMSSYEPECSKIKRLEEEFFNNKSPNKLYNHNDIRSFIQKHGISIQQADIKRNM